MKFYPVQIGFDHRYTIVHVVAASPEQDRYRVEVERRDHATGWSPLHTLGGFLSSRDANQYGVDYIETALSNQENKRHVEQQQG